MRRGRTKRTVFEQVARRMLADARFLLRHGRWHTAVYVAGYAVECLLKAMVCEHKGLERLPEEFEVHHLRKLLESAGLAQALSTQPEEERLFEYIQLTWDVQIRYAGQPYGRIQAEKFFDAVGRFLKWLEEMRLRRK